jgi:hypothetical protein
LSDTYPVEGQQVDRRDRVLRARGGPLISDRAVDLIVFDWRRTRCPLRSHLRFFGISDRTLVSIGNSQLDFPPQTVSAIEVNPIERRIGQQLQ